MTNSPRIAIVGGGPAGLMCARVLQKHGIQSAVYDADAAVDSRDPGGTLDLHADSGQIALEAAGLTEAFRALARVEGQAMSRRDHHGAVLAEFTPAEGDETAPEIDRGQLRTMLWEHLTPGTVRWGHKLRRVTPLGEGAHRLEFANGVSTEADLVIGADGAWSSIRRLLTDAVPRYLGVHFLDARFDDVDTRHPEVAAIVGEGHMFSADGDGRAVIVQRNSNGVVRGYVAFRAEPDWHVAAGVELADREAVRSWLLREFSEWSPVMRPLITDNDGDYVQRGFWALPAPLTWERVPGVTLIGDAAHLMAPFGGHGTNLALLDGAELAHAMEKESGLDDAVARYEAAMFPRSGELAVSSNTALARFFATTSPDAPETTLRKANGPGLVLNRGRPTGLRSATMTTKDFLIADVFTGNPLEGNQLGIFTDARGLDDDLMLKATRELNFSETVFFLKPEPKPGEPKADVYIRIFTPGGEIPFAGHPTLGSAWALAEALNKDTVTIQTQAGLVPVALDRDPANKKLTFGRMEQPIPAPEPCPADQATALVDALGVTGKTGSLPIEIYVNGPRNVYVEIAGEDVVATLDPDLQKLSKIPLNVSCFAQSDDKKTWINRMFAPALGVTEDPATGSAAGPLAVHLARNGRIAFGEEIEIHQGDYINRPSVLYAAAYGTEDAIEKVVVGGRAVVVARGEYQLA